MAVLTPPPTSSAEPLEGPPAPRAEAPRRRFGRRARSAQTPTRPSFRTRLRNDRQMLLMMVPGVLFLLLFFYVPILGNVIAFQDYQPYLGIGWSDFVGIANFTGL